jgi:hypothetical protein
MEGVANCRETEHTMYPPFWSAAAGEDWPDMTTAYDANVRVHVLNCDTNNYQRRKVRESYVGSGNLYYISKVANYSSAG